jgi:hypothetical protein
MGPWHGVFMQRTYATRKPLMRRGRPSVALVLIFANVRALRPEQTQLFQIRIGCANLCKKGVAKIRNWIYICYAVYAELESRASGSNSGRVHGVAKRPDSRMRCGSTRVGSQKVSPTYKLHASRVSASPVYLPNRWIVRGVLCL